MQQLLYHGEGLEDAVAGYEGLGFKFWRFRFFGCKVEGLGFLGLRLKGVGFRV